MKVKYVIALELDDTYAINDDTGEKLVGKDLIDRLRISMSDGDFPIAVEEVVSVEIEQ